MQYVGQTGRSLKTRFREHFRKMKKPKKFDTFLYRHFKNNGHSPSKIVIQPVEKIIYDPNSSTRLKNIKRHETELKWIKFLQSPFPLGFKYFTDRSKAVLLLWIFYVFVLSCVCYVLCTSVYMCFVVTCWERADLLALVCGVSCEFVTFTLVSWVRCGT